MVTTWSQPFSCQNCAESAGSEKSPWSRPGRKMAKAVLAGMLRHMDSQWGICLATLKCLKAELELDEYPPPPKSGP